MPSLYICVHPIAKVALCTKYYDEMPCMCMKCAYFACNIKFSVVSSCAGMSITQGKRIKMKTVGRALSTHSVNAPLGSWDRLRVQVHVV